MMLELWWKVFLASLLTVAIAKLLGAPLGVVLLFALAWIGWTGVFLLLSWLYDLRVARRPPRARRAASLRSLLRLDRPLGEIKRDLAAAGGDSDRAIEVLTTEHCAAILDRFLAGQLDEAELEEWANAVEARDDLGFQPAAEEAIREFIRRLANPVPEGPFSREAARQWQQRFGRARPGAG